MQDVLHAEREDSRATRELWATYNAHMQAFMAVRKKNIVDVSSSDILSRI
jgi:hypothetical protein